MGKRSGAAANIWGFVGVDLPVCVRNYSQVVAFALTFASDLLDFIGFSVYNICALEV